MSLVTLLSQNETATAVDEAILANHLNQIWQRLGKSNSVTVELKITTDAAIQALNRQFLEHDYPTDVLSFPSKEPSQSDQTLLGSIAISGETAKRQAAEAGINLIDEISLLSGHGFLHLLGYNHR